MIAPRLCRKKWKYEIRPRLDGSQGSRRKSMAVRVMIPTPLRVYAGKRDSAEFRASTVGEALAQLTGEFDDLRRHLFTDEGNLRSFVNVYVNGEDIRYLSKEETPTKDGDTISIIPSIAGGSRGEGRLFAKRMGKGKWGARFRQ
jgi:adenylyltransferase/sulfurtransferase